MSEKIHGLLKAKIEKSYFTWFLWLVPLAAACLCVYFVAHDFIFSGPTVTIYLQNADGLREQNSPVKYRGIIIGEIESIKLAGHGQVVAVRAKLDRSAAYMARQGSLFWIVRPELKLGAISGLRTIVSGNYVAVEPGQGSRTNTFIGLEQAPVESIPALSITLLTRDIGSLQEQSPIFYRGIQVGEVTGFHLADEADFAVIDARIRTNYASLVRSDSEFWNAGGIHAHFGLFSGLHVSAESAETLISGGIAFATPEKYGPAATNGSVFILNEKKNDSWKDWNPVIPLRAVPEAQKIKSSLPPLNSK